jgi:hypothetical protein
VVLFFRFYRLDGLPAEMVSDHAEKLLDVNDVLNGDLNVFFPRNTGREAFQFYWTALMSIVFGTGISFMSLKLGTVLGGLVTLYLCTGWALRLATAGWACLPCCLPDLAIGPTSSRALACAFRFTRCFSLRCCFTCCAGCERQPQ